MKNTGITYTSAERSPVILPELAELLPPLSAEQLDALEADLIKNGCYWAIPVRIPGTCTGTESGWLQTGIYLCAAAGQCKKEHRICPAKGAGGVCGW